jgi:putative endonuclease
VWQNLGVAVTETSERERPSSGGGQQAHLELGRRGEELAAEYLRDLGFVVLSRNWRCRDGELDLVTTDGTIVVVCEVKTRSGTGYGAPEEAVTPVKAARIRRLAYRWLQENRVGWCDVRCDVVSVLLRPYHAAQIRHFPGAF